MKLFFLTNIRYENNIMIIKTYIFHSAFKIESCNQSALHIIKKQHNMIIVL